MREGLFGPEGDGHGQRLAVRTRNGTQKRRPAAPSSRNAATRG